MSVHRLLSPGLFSIITKALIHRIAGQENRFFDQSGRDRGLPKHAARLIWAFDGVAISDVR